MLRERGEAVPELGETDGDEDTEDFGIILHLNPAGIEQAEGEDEAEEDL